MLHLSAYIRVLPLPRIEVFPLLLWTHGHVLQLSRTAAVRRLTLTMPLAVGRFRLDLSSRR